MIQQTSLDAYIEVKLNLGTRQKEVYDCLCDIEPATNLMISKTLNLPINSITPRIKELRELKLVGVSKVDKDITTGRNSIYWKTLNINNVEKGGGQTLLVS